MRLSIGKAGSVGVIKDIFELEVPPAGWTDARNTRMGPYGAEKFAGHERALGTGGAAWTALPYWLAFIPVSGGGDFWLGCGANKVYARMAGNPYTETNITRQTAGVDVNYAATETEKWNNSMFGGIAILNNGVDEPQVWNPTTVVTKLVDLNATASGSDAWPTTYRARCVRAFDRFLVAINILKGATRYPQLVKWSHPADPGSMPTSWDPTNIAKDAGEYPLNDATGELVDQLVMRHQNMLYTTNEVWAMSRVGGGDVMGFKRVLGEQGALYTGCVTPFKKGGEFHGVLAGDDIFVHNGQSAESILTPAMRRWFFQQIDPTYYQRCFAVTNPLVSELWFCIPELGSEQPSLALVWSWETNTIGFRDLLKETSNGDTRTTSATKGTPCIAQGYLDDISAETWDSDTASWDSDTTIWDARTSNPATRRLLMADKSAGKRTFLIDAGSSFDTADFAWELERVGLAILGRDQDGAPKADTERIKLLLEIWPRIEASNGTQVQVYVGTSDSADAPVSWSSAYTFTVGTDQFIPVYHSGRYLSVRFAYTGSSTARLLSFDLDIVDGGSF